MTLLIKIPHVSSVVGSRAWLQAKLDKGYLLCASIEYEAHPNGKHLLRLEIQSKNSGEESPIRLTILEENGDVHESAQFEGLPVLTRACLVDLQEATKGMLTQLREEADSNPVRLYRQPTIKMVEVKN